MTLSLILHRYRIFVAASATGALNGASVNFVEGLDDYEAQKKMKSMQRVQQSRNKGGISSKDFLMATRSRILSINSRRYEGSKINTAAFIMHQGVMLPDSFAWQVRKTIVDLTCLFVAVFVPYAVSFDEYIVNEGSFWLLGSIIVNSIFLVDLILEFRTTSSSSGRRWTATRSSSRNALA